LEIFASREGKGFKSRQISYFLTDDQVHKPSTYAYFCFGSSLMLKCTNY